MGRRRRGRGRGAVIPLTLRVALPFGVFVALVASVAALLAVKHDAQGVLLSLLATAMLPTLGLWWLTARYVTRVLVRAHSALDQIRFSDTPPPIPVHGKDEVAMLAQALNAMMERIHAEHEVVRAAALQADDTFLTMMEVLAGAVEARDPYRNGRTKRVTEYALLIAGSMDLPPEGRSILRKAGILHDIGTIAVREEVVREPGPLDSEQQAELMQHPDTAVKMLDGIAFVEAALSVIRHHHEHYDGSGYPLGLKGDDIPVGARILAVADALDAMTTNRPYRTAQTFDFAKREVLNGSGSHFHPEVVTAFIKCQGALRAMVLLQAARARQSTGDSAGVAGLAEPAA